MTQQQLLDAVAIGQFTPGPVLSTATFIGYLILGLPGAIVATLAIFLPSFFFVLALNPLIPKLRQYQWMGAFLDAVNVSAVALMAVVTLRLLYQIVVLSTDEFSLDWIALIIIFLSAIAIFRYKVNTAWLILGGGLFGLILPSG